MLPALVGITGQAYLHAAELAAGFRTAVTIGAGLSAVAAVAAAGLIRNPPRAATG